jgi:hypothetical protein
MLNARLDLSFVFGIHHFYKKNITKYAIVELITLVGTLMYVSSGPNESKMAAKTKFNFVR